MNLRELVDEAARIGAEIEREQCLLEVTSLIRGIRHETEPAGLDVARALLRDVATAIRARGKQR